MDRLIDKTAPGGPGVVAALADIADRFGGGDAEPTEREPVGAEDWLANRAWTHARVDHNDMPLGGVCVDIGMDEGGEYVITVEQTGKKGPQAYRVRRFLVSELLPPETMTASQRISAARWLAGCMKERGKASDHRPDQELVGWIVTLLDKVVSP